MGAGGLFLIFAPMANSLDVYGWLIVVIRMSDACETCLTGIWAGLTLNFRAASLCGAILDRACKGLRHVYAAEQSSII